MKATALPKLNVGLVQYNSDYAHYLPYAVGLLQAYVEHHAPDQFAFLIPRVFAERISTAVHALAEAEVVAFSCYVWNIERSLRVAKALKAVNPEVVIVLGGPQIPDDPKVFLETYPQVDLCCCGEGEQVFLELLLALRQKMPVHTIAGLTGRHEDTYFQNPPGPRRKDLEHLPSPYLRGTFTPLMDTYPDINWSILWETNRGCPFTCGFCDWGSATAAKVNRFDTPRLKAELDWFAAQNTEYIFCCDANFGILPRDVELAKYAVALHEKTGYPGALAVQNAKNASRRTFEIQCMLAESGLDSHVTLSLQSLYPPALKASGRANISLADFERLQSQLRERGIHTYTDLILGLPEETFDSFTRGYAEVIERGQYYAINVYILDLLPNAAMAHPVFRKDYGLETVKVPSVNFHQPVKARDPDGIVEWQELVIATRAMPRQDWARSRQFIGLAELLFFKPGLLRIPLMLLHHYYEVPMLRLLKAFFEASTPLLTRINNLFYREAEHIQAGNPVYVNVQGVWRGPYDKILQHLLQQRLLGAFYQEAEALLQGLLPQTNEANFNKASEVLEDALFLSASFAHLRYQQDLPGLRYVGRWNVWEYYQSLLQNQRIALQPQRLHFSKSWRGAPWRLNIRRHP